MAESSKAEKKRRQNRSKAEIAEGNLNAEVRRRDAAKARLARLEKEIIGVKERIDQHEVRIQYLQQNPDLPKGGAEPETAVGEPAG